MERKLKKIFWLKREIASKENRLADMIDEATHITAILTQTRSSEVANKPENYAVRSYELKLSLEDDIENLMQQMEEENGKKEGGESPSDESDDPLLFLFCLFLVR